MLPAIYFSSLCLPSNVHVPTPICQHPTPHHTTLPSLTPSPHTTCKAHHRPPAADAGLPGRAPRRARLRCVHPRPAHCHCPPAPHQRCDLFASLFRSFLFSFCRSLAQTPQRCRLPPCTSVLRRSPVPRATCGKPSRCVGEFGLECASGFSCLPLSLGNHSPYVSRVMEVSSRTKENQLLVAKRLCE